MHNYENAKEYMERGQYDLAIEYFNKCLEYQDSEKMIIEAKYQRAVNFFKKRDYKNARLSFSNLNNYKDSTMMISQINEAIYQTGLQYFEQQNYRAANQFFSLVPQYLDAPEYIRQIAFILTLNGTWSLYNINTAAILPETETNVESLNLEGLGKKRIERRKEYFENMTSMINDNLGVSDMMEIDLQATDDYTYIFITVTLLKFGTYEDCAYTMLISESVNPGTLINMKNTIEEGAAGLSEVLMQESHEQNLGINNSVYFCSKDKKVYVYAVNGTVIDSVFAADGTFDANPEDSPF